MSFSIDTLPLSPFEDMEPAFSAGAKFSPPSPPSAMLGRPSRYRSLSLSEVGGGFCRLEVSIPGILATDLPGLAAQADRALKGGVAPSLADACCGGTYFLRDPTSHFICVVFKPADEEPFAPNNPHLAGQHAGKFNKSYKGNIFPGFGLYRELAAFALDSGGAGVPATQLAKVHHKSFRTTEQGLHDYKIGSVQSYVRDIECSAEDMGPAMMHADDIQRVAVLDIRLCNLDRHPGNLLVCRTKLPTHTSDDTVEEILQSNLISVAPSALADQAVSVSRTACFQPVGAAANASDISKSCPADVGTYLQASNASSTKRYVFSRLQEEEGAAGRDSSHSPSPRAVVDNGTSPRASVTGTEDRKLRLVPIDHGYCLPHVLHLSETNFAWMYWPQAAAPVSDDLKKYIASLDADRDCDTVRHLVGAAINEPYLLTLRVCTMLLQIGVAAGLTLRTIGELMTPAPGRDDDAPSPLQLAVYEAVSAVVRRTLSSSSGEESPGSSPGRLAPARMKHSSSESSLIDMEVLCLSSPPRVPVQTPPRLEKCRHTAMCNFHDDCTVTAPTTFSSLNKTKFFPTHAEADILSMSSGTACSEDHLQLAMGIDGGTALLDAFCVAITALVMSSCSKTV
jgi:hypothetical protein